MIVWEKVLIFKKVTEAIEQNFTDVTSNLSAQHSSAVTMIH